MTNHFVLLGDSIFDNESYVGEHGFPVIKYLQDLLGEDSKANLLAVDGHVIKDVYRQAKKIPKGTSQIFLSVGGNDITRHLYFLEQPVNSVAEVLLEFNRLVEEFQEDYFKLLQHLNSLQIPLTTCSIYNCSFEPDLTQVCVETALRMFNDAIIQSAYELSVPYIDLRIVCTDPSDFVEEIEPSNFGGKKIAEALYKHICESD